MDEFNYLQFLNDDSELLEAEEVLLGEFPTFSVQFDEYFDNFSSTSAPDACDLHRGQTSEHAREIARGSLHSIWKIYTHVATSSCGQEQRNFLCISRKFTGDE